MTDRIAELLKENRMHSGESPADQLHGLYDLIKEYFNPNFIIAEIGSFSGASTELFALTCKKIYSIDPYMVIKNQENDKQLNQAESKFIERMANYKNVVKIRDTSDNASKQFDDNSFDAVYIDGDHRYDSVIKDIKTWIPKVKKNGILCGHDYYESIKIAVNDTIGEPDKVYKDSSWVYFKKNNI